MIYAQLIPYLAILQGSFVLGLLVNIVWHFATHKPLKFSTFQILILAISYACVVAATLITLTDRIYEMGSLWYWLVGFGYFFGDMGLLTVYVHQRTRQVTQEYRDRIDQVLRDQFTLSPKTPIYESH